MKWLRNLWCDFLHEGGDIKRDEQGRINWQCRSCGRWADAVPLSVEERVVSNEIKKREHLTDGQPCWCGPEVTEVNPATGTSVVVHKDAIDWRAVADDQAKTIALLRAELEETKHRPIYVADVTMPDPEDSLGYTDK